VESGTTELALPGLELAGVGAQVEPGHWIARGPQKRLMLFAGRSHPDLADAIAHELGLYANDQVELGQVTLKTFANGETYCRYEESIRGADLFLVQTGCVPVDRNLMELLIMINAAKLASAKRITAVIPWFPYSRQDKKSAPREPISSKLVADLLERAGADRVLTMDLHAGQIQGFFTIPVDHMRALPLFVQHFRDKGLYGDKVVSVSPDAGRAKVATKFGQMLDAPTPAIMNKVRPAHDEAEVTTVIGDVTGKVAIMSDDMIITGGTLIAGADALINAGATEVWACATHGLFPDGALARLEASQMKGIVVTDTVPINPIEKPDKLEVISVSRILAETIWNVFSDESVSAIFAGENQLF
jgi:ribose-phosphate pyrophosphokinase